MRPSRSARPRAAVFLASAVLALVVVALAGCKGINAPNTETQGAVLSTGTVQAPASEGVTTSSSVSASASAPATAAAAAPAAPAAPKIWPAKVGSFAKRVKSPVWYPKSLTKGYATDSIDVVELDAGTGLICDIAYVSGDKAITFTQGSPKERSYDIVSVGKTPWGTGTADVMHQDPADTTTPLMIVYNHGGNFAELQGDASIAELKAIAASMVPVK
jgi:hypothetical protein